MQATDRDSRYSCWRREAYGRPGVVFVHESVSFVANDQMRKMALYDPIPTLPLSYVAIDKALCVYRACERTTQIVSILDMEKLNKVRFS